MTYTDVLKKVKPAKKGVAEIVHDKPSQLERLRGAMNGQPLTRPKYCRLIVRGDVVMTDAEFERKTNIDPVIKAHGHALIAGLGIGLILQPIIDRCETVTVIEKEQDVIDLVAKAFPTVYVIHADIFEWEAAKKAKYDLIYFDIWPGVCADDLEQAKELHKRFRKHLNKNGFMHSWCRTAMIYLR